jgi:hypothetical protein
MSKTSSSDDARRTKRDGMPLGAVALATGGKREEDDHGVVLFVAIGAFTL